MIYQKRINRSNNEKSHIFNQLIKFWINVSEKQFDHWKDKTKIIKYVGQYFIHQKFLDSLGRGQCLYDSIIDSYLLLLTKSDYIKDNYVNLIVLDTVFPVTLAIYTPAGNEVRKRAIENEYWKADIILSPVCQDNHWTHGYWLEEEIHFKAGQFLSKDMIKCFRIIMNSLRTWSSNIATVNSIVLLA